MRFRKGITSKLCVLVFAFMCGSLQALAANSLPNTTSETDAIAKQLLDKFNEGDQKAVLVIDSDPSFGDANSFGAWLADQLAASLASQGKNLTLTDRARIATGLESLHLAPKDARLMPNAVSLGKSLGASTIILSSYGFANNGIGVTAAAFRVSEFAKPQATDFMIGVVFGKISLSKEVTARLGVPLDSLRPKDGIYRSGYGGVSIPDCVKCPVPGMKVPDVDLQGMLRAHPQGATVSLEFVVTPEGHTQDIKVLQPVGYGFDEQYVKAAQGWELKPAVGPDGKPVPVLYDFTLSFKFK